MEMLLDEIKNLVCGFCELFIVNPDDLLTMLRPPLPRRI